MIVFNAKGNLNNIAKNTTEKLIVLMYCEVLRKILERRHENV